MIAADPFQTDAITHVLLETDGSETAERAQRWALGIARFWGARVTVVCAFDSPRSIRKRASMMLPEVRDEMQREAEEVVSDAVAELRDAGVQASGVAFEGNAVDAMLDLVEKDPPEVIVIGGGSHEDGVRDYLVGSVAERIVRHAPVSVLVIR